MFKKLRSVAKSYDEQGLIYFTCKNYHKLGIKEREHIRRLSSEVGGDYSQALFELLTTSRSVQWLSMKHFISNSTLYELRKRFFENWRNFNGR